MDPAALAAFTPGPKAASASKAAGELLVRMGHRSGISLRVKHPGVLRAKARVDGNIVEGKVDTWRRVVVLSRIEDKTRLFILEPGSGDEELEVGPFFVRGPFRIAERENDAERAAEAWKVEKAS